MEAEAQAESPLLASAGQPDPSAELNGSAPYRAARREQSDTGQVELWVTGMAM